MSIISYGTISPEEKLKIFKTYMNYLLENGYDFSIKNYEGDIKAISLTCEKLGLSLDLELDSTLSRNNLMAHTKEHHFMVNSLDYLMEETIEKTNSEVEKTLKK